MKQLDKVESATVEYPRGSESNSLWQVATIALMVVGYAGYYLCRSDLSVATPLILAQYKSIGITKATLGLIATVATFCYAGGKFLFGNFADVLGGRRSFLLGMGGAILFTVLFAIGGPALFMFAWCGNKFIQSSGWVGMVKITSRWFSHKRYGTVMGVISLSYLFGDAASRWFLGVLINRGWSWQEVFFVSAAVLGVIFVPTVILLRNSPAERQLPEPEANPESVFIGEEDAVQIKSPLELLKPLFSSPSFWVVCVLSFGFTFMRETFNTWIPTYLNEAAKMSKGDAAQASSLFSLFGGFSVLGVGYLSDRLPIGGRAGLIAIGLLFSTAGLLFLAFGDFHGSATLYVAMTAVIAIVMIGPYSFLAGAVSLDFGGKQASATAAGWIDGIGYFGGMLAGYVIGSIAERSGWASAFEVLALTAFLSFLVALVYWRSERQRAAALGIA